MRSFSAVVTISMILAIQTDGFVVHRRLSNSPVAAPYYTVLKARTVIQDLSPKEFQLEELEDKEECETEVWLNQDGTVTLGRTNGPAVSDYRGDWHLIETATDGDHPFRMRLTRVYDASGHSGPNQVGDFSYEVTREFQGSVEMMGDSITVSGATHGIDEQSLLDAEVGYFTMVDSAASEGVEGERSDGR